MKKENEIKIFEDKKVRTVWDSEQEKWYISIIDVVAVLTGQNKIREQEKLESLEISNLMEGNETVTNCNQLKMEAPDGKMRLKE